MNTFSAWRGRSCTPAYGAPQRTPKLAHPPTKHHAVNAIGKPRHAPRRVWAGGVSFEGPIPEGVQVSVKAPSDGEAVDWDPESKTLRLPYSVVEASGERRTKLVIFTCNKCGARTARNVNPVAWEKGLVMGQCAGCEAWHVLSAKNPLIYEEIRYERGATEDGHANSPDSRATPASAAIEQDPGL